MMNKNRAFISSIVLLILLFSCNENPLISLKKEIQPIHFVRFDKDMSQMDTNSFVVSDQNMWQKHPEMYSFYYTQLMGVRNFVKGHPEMYASQIKPYIAGEYQALQDSCMKLYEDLSDIEQEVTTAFSHYQYYFPKSKLPVIYSMVISPNGYFPAAFNYGNDTLGINLFCYLGEGFTFYNGIYDQYWKKWLKKEYITRNIMLVQYQANENSNRPNWELIFEMIEAGKRLYFLDCMMPEHRDEIKIGYTDSQLKWCNENEKEIWKFLVENKLMYSMDNMDYKRMVQEGPTTSGMPAESPGMVGQWVGWQIVRKYMKEHPKISLDQLIYKTDPKIILRDAKYKP